MRIPIGSFTIEVPDTWRDRTVHTFVAPKVYDPRQTPHLRMGSGLRENISISRERVRRGTNPQDYLLQQVEELKARLSGLRLLYEEPLHIGGYLAHSISYQFSLRGERVDVCQMRVALLYEQEMINFTGTAAATIFESKKAIFLRIVNSFQFPPPSRR